MKWLELRLPPPLVLLGLGTLTWCADRFAPSLSIPLPGRSTGVALLLVCAAWIGLNAVQALRQARTTVLPHRPEQTSALVTGGIYRFSRNPMYLAMLFALAAWAWILGNALGFLALPAFVCWMNRFQIGPEERALRAGFGEAFADYERMVRRWI